jgi:hypothetical protein
MRRLFVLAVVMAAIPLSVLSAGPAGRQSTISPVLQPIPLLDREVVTSPPPHWVPKRLGHYSLTDWRRVIDSTWGQGLPVSEKLAIFDMFWNTIDSNFACFNNLDVNWDSLRTAYRTEVEDTVSRGRFEAIMTHLAHALREGHTAIIDNLVNWSELLPGVPLWVIGGWWYVDHFGAALTPLPDSSLLVYRVVRDHPLGLEPGDLVLGYDRRLWTDILRELQAAQLPFRRCMWWGSSGSSMTHSLLIAAGMNWHLFDTIDIVKSLTGDTVHLPTSLLVGDSMRLFATEQMDIAGVPMPSADSIPSVTYGTVSGTRIGYIYGWRWMYNAETEFYNAISALVSDTTLKGIIIDFRYNQGGSMFMSSPGLQLLFRDSTSTICMSSRSSPHDHFAMRAGPASGYVIHGNGIGYDKPIAVLVGPGAISSGDQVAFRMTFHPRVRTFGKSTCTAFTAPVSLSMPTGWSAGYAVAEACLASDTTYFLTHREFPVDVPVWHTRDAVANGRDAVVEAAIAWIDSGGAVSEAPDVEVRTTNAATVVRGVLYLPEASSHKPQAASLMDATGRRVTDLRPGANDVSRLSPGVYFVRSAGTENGKPRTETRKVILGR